MSAIQKLNKSLSNFIDIKFALTFIILTTVFYYFNLGYIAITDRQGLIYSDFLTKHLDYISWVRSSIVHTSQIIAQIFGVDCYITDTYVVKSYTGAYVSVGFPCVGYGVTSFWLAFVIAQGNCWKRTVFWCVIGAIALWLINCIRVAILLLAYNERWHVNRFADHHTTFNIISYLLIILMTYIYYRSKVSDKKSMTKYTGGKAYKQVIA